MKGNRTRKWTQKIWVDNDIGHLQLTRIRDGYQCEHLFDSVHLDFVQAHGWSSTPSTGYAHTSLYACHDRRHSQTPDTFYALHWLPFTYEQRHAHPQAEVDHINRLRWDSRSANLRLVTRAINQRNRSDRQPS